MAPPGPPDAVALRGTDGGHSESGAKSARLRLYSAAVAGDSGTRMKPLIGISCCVKPFGIFGTPNHAASDSYVRVVLGPVDGIPVLLPAAGEGLAQQILPRLDGLILTGSRSNVCPER